MECCHDAKYPSGGRQCLRWTSLLLCRFFLGDGPGSHCVLQSCSSDILKGKYRKIKELHYIDILSRHFLAKVIIF